MIPRDYQVDALTAIKTSLDHRVWSQMLVVPTGGGKTVIFALLLDTLKEWIAREPWMNQRMLIIAHRDELLDQARKKLIAANPGIAVEIEQGDQHVTPMAEVVIASIQTLAARNYARLDALDVRRFKIIVVDEAHHAAADTYQGVLARLGVLPPVELLPPANSKDRLALHAGRVRVQQWWQAQPATKLLLGVTATPSRSDAVGLEWTFRQVVYEKTLRWMIERGYLVPPRGYLVETGLNLDTVKTIGGDFQQKGLSAIVNTQERNQALAAAWQQEAIGRPTLVFGVDVQHAHDLADAFSDVADRVVALDGSATREHRASVLQQFARGEIQVLTNCALFTEGFDEPSIGCVVLARPTKSQTLYSQMVGRGLRLFDGKSDCIVLDGCDNSQRHSLVTLGDLFGFPSTFNLNGRDAVKAAARMEQLAAQFPALDTGDVRSLDELEARVRSIDLFKPRSSATVTEHASMCWIAHGQTRFTLALTQRIAPTETEPARNVSQTMEIRQHTLGDWQVVLRGADVADYQIAICDDVRDAFATGERWVAVHLPDVAKLTNKDAAWRTRPPTAKQITKLQEWGCTRLPATRGEASEMMDAYITNKKRRA